MGRRRDALKLRNKNRIVIARDFDVTGVSARSTDVDEFDSSEFVESAIALAKLTEEEAQIVRRVLTGETRRKIRDDGVATLYRISKVLKTFRVAFSQLSEKEEKK